MVAKVMSIKTPIINKDKKPCIVTNMAKCRQCGEIIVSTHRHDFVTCPCKSISVDGGHEYLKRSAKSMDDIEEMSVFADECYFCKTTDGYHKSSCPRR